MKIALVLLGLTAFAAASMMPMVHKTVADKVYLQKQKAILELVWRVNQPAFYPEILEIANNYVIEENLDKYTNVEAIKNFVYNYKYGMLPQGEIFSVFNDKHKEEAITLFDLFYYAKDFDTFYKTAAWARVHMNAGQFVYAFSIAVLHREDTKGLVLPPPYEIYPHLFVDNEVVQQAYEAYMQKLGYTNQKNAYVIQINKTNTYPYYMYNNGDEQYNEYKYQYNYDYNLNVHPENRLNYFTEDVALNTYHNYFHLDNPFWMNATYGYKTERRGELFYYYHQQILARYLLERLSNDLFDIDSFKWENTVQYGYNPNMRYPNGKDFPVRADNFETSKYNTYEVKLVQDFERRIRDAIDLGYVYTEKGEKVSISDERGIDILGHLVQATVDSVNYKYYGKLYTLTLQLLGHIVDPYHGHNVAPGVLEQYETLLRDPLYYRFLGTITQLFLRYKSHLPYYQRDELYFSGVKVDSVDVDKLITYFENFEYDISTAIKISKPEDEEFVIKARQYRLNHKPFTYKVNVVSDKNADVMVRVFIGPKYDAEGRVLDINDKRKLMVELDRFPYTINAGRNAIIRDSKFFSRNDEYTNTRDMYEKVVDALGGASQYYVDEVDNQCGYPSHLVLPKGKRGGMPFTFFVAVTPLTEKVDDVKYYQTVGCSNGLGLFYNDKYAMGYPFDRVIDETQFYVPNFYEKEVMIFHKRSEDMINHSI